MPFHTDSAIRTVVFRYHGGEAEVMKQNPAAGEEGYMVGKNCVTIYARSFSPYAIGYNVPSYAPNYSVTSPSAENGKVTVNSNSAPKGSTVSISATPDEGYRLSGLTVTDKDGNEIEVTKKSDGTYTFKMPDGKVTIEAKFVQISAHNNCPKDETCPIHGFTDASITAWYHDGVHYCVDNGLMSGYGNGIFKPNADTTRAMIIATLWRLNGSPVVDDLLDFEDVADGQWYTEAIRWAKSKDIAAGYGNGIFGANDAVTREQVVAMLWRYAKYKGYDVSAGESTNILSYDDAFNIAEYAIPAMQWACGSGMMQGMAAPDGDGMILAPEGRCTRAQIATMIMRLCVEMEK